MKNREDAVSEAIGGVLLIALVVIGAAIVGTYVASQPLPEKIPKIQFSVKQVGDSIILEHEGGETLDSGIARVKIGDKEYEQQITNWKFGEVTTIGVPDSDPDDRASVALVYSGGSGETLLRAPGSPWGFEYSFPVPDPFEVVSVPDYSWDFGDFTCWTYEWPDGYDPQPFFAPANPKHVYVAAFNSEIDPPEPPLFVCDGTNDEKEINDAIAIAQGGVIELLDGNFRCSSGISVADETTLIGQGSFGGSTGFETVIETGATSVPITMKGEYVNLGGFTLRGNAFVRITKSHARIRDIYATSVDLDGVWHKASERGMFSVLVGPPQPTVDDVEFYRCIASQCHTHGFHLDQVWDGTPRATTNIRIVQCGAALCGFGVAGDPGIPSSVTATNQSRSEWITGFDLHEWQDLVNLEVVGCVALNNWESGFHLEPGARYGANGENIGPRTVSKNIVFRDCVSSNNGRSTYTSHFFMSGYYLSRDTRLENCISSKNRNAGFYVHGGDKVDFVNCRDDGSTYGWKICKASKDITLDGCSSANNLRWALWLSFSNNIKVTNFVHTYIVGERGYQNILGWYKDEAKYQVPVTNSEFQITAVGNTMPIMNCAGSGNTYDLTYG